ASAVELATQAGVLDVELLLQLEPVGRRHGRDQSSADPGAVGLKGVLLAADLRLQAGPVIVALQGQRVEKLDARVEAEPPKVDHRHRRRSAGLEMYQVEELVVEQAGSAIERRNLLRGRALNRLKGGRATIALPVASCNHQVITVAGSHRSE